MKKFKHLRLTDYHTTAAMDDRLEKLGADGWEAVSVVVLPNNMVMYLFKREFTEDEYAEAGDLGWMPA